METLEFADWTLLLHVATTFALVGLIWFVQVVHYPLMAQVPREGFRRYELDHQRLTTWIVAPLMLAELLSAVLLFWYRPEAVDSIAVWLGFLLLLTIWLATYTVQVPQHASMVLSYDPLVHRRLVLGNWFRTIAWSARGLIVLWMVGQLIMH